MFYRTTTSARGYQYTVAPFFCYASGMATQIFKHMMPKDIPVFSTYVLSPEGKHFTGWEFDVLVGKPEDPGPYYPLEKRRQALALRSLKIDAIGWLFQTPCLIECKPDAGLSAIGQVNGYATYYERMFGVYPRKMIVCESMRNQIQILCDVNSIDVRIVPPADTETIVNAVTYVVPLLVSSPLGPNPLALPKL